MKNNFYPLWIYLISLIIYLAGLLLQCSYFLSCFFMICFFLLFTVLFVKLGFRSRFKECFIGLILLEFQFLISSVLYMIYMNGEIMLPSELSVVSLLNVFYSFYKPFTRIFTDDHYNKYLGIADVIFSMLLPIVLFYIGKLLKKISENKKYGV